MNADEARRLTDKNSDGRLQERIEIVERRVLRACERGCNSICLGSLDQYKNPIEFEVKEHFRKQGYKFRPTGYSGGVWQHTEDMYW